MRDVDGIRAVLESPGLAVERAVGAAFATPYDGIGRDFRFPIIVRDIACGASVYVAMVGNPGAADIAIDMVGRPNDCERVGGIEGELGPVSLLVDVIDILDDLGPVLVDETGFVARVGGDARGQLLPERDIDHGVDAVPEVAGLRLVLKPYLDGPVEALGVGFPGDVADRPDGISRDTVFDGFKITGANGFLTYGGPSIESSRRLRKTLFFYRWR